MKNIIEQSLSSQRVLCEKLGFSHTTNGTINHEDLSVKTWKISRFASCLKCKNGIGKPMEESYME